MADRVTSFGTTIFAEMTALANEHQAINLGQGFPDFPAPDFLKEAAVAAIRENVNQYAPSIGSHLLRQAVADSMLRHHDMTIDPDREVTITHGATEAIFAAIIGLVNPGDEVILFEPYYDSYVPSVQIAGGTPRFFTLRPPDWTIDREELASLFSDKTKLIVINTPHNPTGKLFTKEELQLIAELCQTFDVIALTDEVYEHIIFDGHPHHCLARLPGMAERTVTISSLGKSFSVTGWKVGWAAATDELTRALRSSHQFITFCGAAPLQEAAVKAMATSDSYFKELRASYQHRRDFLVRALKGAGLEPIVPLGTYFILVDISSLGFPDDVTFCRHLTTHVGVAAIPPSAFYHDPADGAGLARFAFCKTEDTLEEAARRLEKLA
jgi:N-succinyldiaminopimelate aminotransferase